MDATESAVNLAKLAREIAMDIFPLDKVLSVNRLSTEEWASIQQDPRFQRTLKEMIAEWNAAGNARERVRIKAATGFEMLMETYLEDAVKEDIPLIQRLEVGKLMARLGELEAQKAGSGGGQVLIQINFGEKQVTQEVPALKAIEGRSTQDE
jgi:hypothetical protein